MYAQLLKNHILTSLIALLLLALGFAAYQALPREQDPTVNFNYIDIRTTLPGAAAEDVEAQVTDVLEQAVRRVRDLRSVTSVSRAGASTIGVRFLNLDDETFAERLGDLRREIQNSADLLPAAASQPLVTKLTSANSNASVMLILAGDETTVELMRLARRIEKDLENFAEVEEVRIEGEREPELQVLFEPARLLGLGVAPTALADTVSAYFRDLAAGTLQVGSREWLVRVQGTSSDPGYLAGLPVLTAQGEVPLRSVAEVRLGLAEPMEMVRYQNRPALLLNVVKQGDANVFELVRQVEEYLRAFNRQQAGSGVELVLLSDQTAQTQHAIGVMEANALTGLVLVLLVTWLFLGGKLALLTSLGLPLVLAGSFIVLHLLDQTLNVVVLLGLVIVLGMLVDDAVVVVDAIHLRLQRGRTALDAAVSGVREVAAPVTAAVLTTIAAFLPLMLLPGVLGDYMRVTPLVVVVALTLSLIEAFWILPSHIVAWRSVTARRTAVQRLREAITRRIRHAYTKLLLRALRRSRWIAAAAFGALLLALGAVSAGAVRMDFFASDPARIFYISLSTPPGTTLTRTLEAARAVEQAVNIELSPEELRGSASYAGVQYGPDGRASGSHLGQVAVSLQAPGAHTRSIGKMIELLRTRLHGLGGIATLSFYQVTSGPPVDAPINVKVRGDSAAEIRAAADRVAALLQGFEGVRDIRDDDARGRAELTLRLDSDAITRVGLDPNMVARSIRLLSDGEVAAAMRERGEPLGVRVKAAEGAVTQLDDFLRHDIALADGGAVALAHLVHAETAPGADEIRHYNFRRAISVMAEIDPDLTDTVSVNRRLQALWESDHARFYPQVVLDFSGELDDIEESLASLGGFFLLGLGLIYLILATQFRSYLQPLIVLAAVPLAFIGVVIGLMLSRMPLSLYTIYGIVALAGVTVNGAIVLVSAANAYQRAGLGPWAAAVCAARRRVIPILISSVTTMAGLWSLATGLAGESRVWGAVAGAIIWGLGFSTLLSLFVTPLLYGLSSKAHSAPRDELPALPRLQQLEANWLARWRAHIHLSARERSDLNLIHTDQHLRILYLQGYRALATGNAWIALKHFQEAAALAPDNIVTNAAAARASFEIMKETGYDEGYGRRMRRFLQRIRRIDPEAPALAALEAALRRLRRARSHRQALDSPTRLKPIRAPEL